MNFWTPRNIPLLKYNQNPAILIEQNDCKNDAWTRQPFCLCLNMLNLKFQKRLGLFVKFQAGYNVAGMANHQDEWSEKNTHFIN